MTRIVLVAIACDICDTVCPGSARPTAREARAIAKDAGWIKRNNVRRCPACTTPTIATAATAAAGNP